MYKRQIETLGNYQKTVLLSSIVVLSLIFGGFLGLLSQRRSEISYFLFIAFGIFGGWTLNRDPLTSTSAALSLSVFATLIGLSTLTFLNTLLDEVEDTQIEDPRNTYANRRQFINWATGMTVAAGTMTGFGRLVLKDETVRNIREKIVLPQTETKSGSVDTQSYTEVAGSSTTTTTPSSESNLLSFSEMNDIEGISSYITPNNEFYRIDTALRVPTVEPSTWTLTIDGLTANPYEISYDEILEIDLVKKDVT